MVMTSPAFRRHGPSSSTSAEAFHTKKSPARRRASLERICRSILSITFRRGRRSLLERWPCLRACMTKCRRRALQ
jgi:hypothetical protein